jgi:protein arginine N-methyltransferase 1
MTMVDAGPVEGFAGFFDVTFAGSKEQPADSEVVLTTAPDPTGATHWGQQSFYVNPAIDCAPGDSLRCGVNVTRRSDNQRLLNVGLSVRVEGGSMFAERSKAGAPRELQFAIE